MGRFDRARVVNAIFVRMRTETSPMEGVSRRIVSSMDPMRTDTTLSLSPEPKLHGQRRCESALFDLRNVVELQVAQADAMTKRAPASTGFVDVKSLLGIDHASNMRAIVPPARGLVTLVPPPPSPVVTAVQDRDAKTRRALYALCLGMLAVLVAMAIKVLG
jgi:hypothetical protein